MKSRFSDPLKKARRCQAECEEENYLSLVSRGCADPMSRPHFLPAHPHHDYSPAEKLKQVFSISCLKVHVRAIRQKGRDPHAGAAEEQNIEFCSPSWGRTLAQSPPRSVGWDKWEGKEKALVRSHACSGTRLRCAPTHLLELWSPLDPPAQTQPTGTVLANRSNAFDKNITQVFNGTKVKQVPWQQPPTPLRHSETVPHIDPLYNSPVS